MKILYVTPKINNEGGVARVLSIKTDFLIEKLGHQVAILTQNEGNTSLFFNFNSKIDLLDIKLSTNKFKLILDYKKQVSEIITKIQPDVIVVSDNGLKGFLFPILLPTKVPIVFEVHGSKFNEEFHFKKNRVTNFFHTLKYKIRNFGASKFDYFIALSKESAAEWNIKNTQIIPNPIWLNTEQTATLESNKVIFVGRHSYEKGLDRMLKIWEKVSAKHPNWVLEIYGKRDVEDYYLNLSKNLKLENTTFFFEPISNIHEKYLTASLFVMSSRHEGFPMALLEAMSCGLPVVAFDCPIGPKSIVTNTEDGYLVKEDDLDAFATKLDLLIADVSLRKKMGLAAKRNVSKYNIETITEQWDTFFKAVK